MNVDFDEEDRHDEVVVALEEREEDFTLEYPPKI